MVKFINLPFTIQYEMLLEQVRAGNPRDANVFIKSITANRLQGGFFWVESTKGKDYWMRIIHGVLPIEQMYEIW